MSFMETLENMAEYHARGGSNKSKGKILADWCVKNLKVPSGPKMGEPFKLDDWQKRFIYHAMLPRNKEAGLSVARKNGKTGLIAALVMAHLCEDGPFNEHGWNCAVVSLTHQLTMELRRAIKGMITVSGIQGLRVMRDKILGANESEVMFLASDRATGHALSLDMVIIDEAGLLLERDRDLWDALLTSMSVKDGRLIAISIKGDGPMFDDLRERQNELGVYWEEYTTPNERALDDVEGWHMSNPGLRSGIKSKDYMKRMAARAAANPAHQPNFRAYDLNMPQDPNRSMIVAPSDWMENVVAHLPERKGPVVVGLDIGGNQSMTADACYWPVTGRLEVHGGFPDTPDLQARGKADGIGSKYVQMAQRGELKVYPGRVLPVDLYLGDLETRLAGHRVIALISDRFRQEELFDALENAGIRWPVVLRGGTGSFSNESSADVKGFQAEVFSKHMKVKRNLMLEDAIAVSSIVFRNGNPILEKATSRGRIDALSATVLALSQGGRWRTRPVSKGAYKGFV